MKNNKESTHTPKELIGELQTLVTEAQTMMTGPLTEHSAEAFGRLRDRFHAAQERLGDLHTEARRKGTAGAKYTDETIRANPYQSLAVAAGIGLLVGVLLSRRSE